MYLNYPKKGKVMKNYVGSKKVKATPMNRLNYHEYRGWDLLEKEKGADEGYLVEYLNESSGSNHKNHKGCVSWSPKAAFEESYKEISNDITYIDRMRQEFKETYERLQGAKAYVDKNKDIGGSTPDNATFNCAGYSSPSTEINLLVGQIYNMEEYLKILGSHIVLAEAKEGLL